MFPASVPEWELDSVTVSAHYLVLDKLVSALVNDSLKDWSDLVLVLEWLREYSSLVNDSVKDCAVLVLVHEWLRE